MNAFIAKRDRNLKPEHKLHHQVTDRMLIASVTTDTGVTKTTGIAFLNTKLSRVELKIDVSERHT